MPRLTAPFVDYGRVAGRYDTGRSPDGTALAQLRAAVVARLPSGGWGRVLDAGAGTGHFASAWSEWGAALVVAVEPSAAMRCEASRRVGSTAAVGGRVAVVGGVAERLPLASGSADVAWLSAVVHHLADPGVVAGELRRVVRPGGRIFVRGLFTDRGRVPWLAHFPGAERALARFPSTGRTTRVFVGAGVEPVDVVDVPATEPGRFADAARWVRSMRDADTLLTALSDEEIDAGVGSLLASPAAVLGPTLLSVLTFEVPAR